MLTRVRNALRARHQKVDVPASKLKMEIARILKEEGYIINFKLAEDGTQKIHSSSISSTLPTNEPAIAAHRACFASRLPRVCRQQGYSARARRSGNKYSDNAARRDDRPRRPQGRRRRRIALSGLVTKDSTNVRVGKKPIPLPSGVKINIGDQLQVEGPKGKLTVPIPAGIRVEQNNGTLNIVRDNDHYAAAARFDPRAGRQRRHRCSTGFTRELDIVGIGYRVDIKGASRSSHSVIRTRSSSCCRKAST